MLIKAIMTGGVLSILAGVGVYFGTEGIDTLESSTSETVQIEDTELAGAANVSVDEATTEKAIVEKIDVEDSAANDVADEDTTAVKDVVEQDEVVVEDVTEEEVTQEEVTQEVVDVDEAAEEVMTSAVDAQDPPRETSKPERKWLDQYLKKTKPAKTSEDMVSETADDEPAEPEVEMVKEEVAPEAMAPEEMAKEEMAKEEMNQVEKAGEEIAEMAPAAKLDETADSKTDAKERARLRTEQRKKRLAKRRMERRNAAQGEGKRRIVVKNEKRAESLNLDGDIDIEMLKEEFGIDSDKNIQVRVIRKNGDDKSMTRWAMKDQTPTDYAPILVEAKKLLVTDMRNSAFLEIIDHAIDHGDIGQAADVVDELSTPELRDTARARIGTGLARSGDTEAAFAVLDEIEIDELAAPIRLEIITALMATKQERKAIESLR